MELLIIPAISIFSIIVLIVRFRLLDFNNQDDTIICISMGLAIVNVITVLLMERVLKRERVIRENRVVVEKAKSEMNMYHVLSDNLEKQRKISHEYNNKLECMRELIKKGELSELQNYFEKVGEEMLANGDMVDTNNTTVNAVINTKYREAMKKGIVFVLKVNDLSNIGLSEIDVVTLLSNLLNNAIEACEKCEKKVIKLKFVQEDDQTVIAVKNSMPLLPVQHNGGFLTSKSDQKEEHGFGIHNIIDVVERNHGRYLIDHDENEFSVSILF